MKFKAFPTFTKAADVAQYLSVQLASTFKDLYFGLQKLTFADNFESFEVEVTFQGNEEVPINNPRDYIPTRWLVVDRDAAGGIIRGSQGWTANTVYLKNAGPNTVTATIIFLR